MKQKLEAKSEIIFSRPLLEVEVSQKIKGHIKWMNSDLNFPNTYIHNHKLTIINWRANPLLIITINDTEIADTYSSFFNELWKNKSLCYEEVIRD